MACNNGLFGGNCCSWIIILLVLMCFCGGEGGYTTANNCGCGGCGNCGCQNNCGC